MRDGPDPIGRDDAPEIRVSTGGETSAKQIEPAPANNPLPVRMLNEYAYCPRLFHLMHVEGRWADNAYTVEGKSVHRRVDQLDHVLPDPDRDNTDRNNPDTDESDSSKPKSRGKRAARDDGDEPPVISRSVPLDSTRLGLTAKLDLVSTATAADGTAEAVPVETKRGRVPNNDQRSYEPERVQLMAQGLLLREHGYDCDHGVLYFSASRTRVDVPFTDQLEERTLNLIKQAQETASNRILPPPLDDSPKCAGCSLNGICLPDETMALKNAAGNIDKQHMHKANAAGQSEAISVRRLYPARDNALPLYVQEQGATVGKSGTTLIVRKGKNEMARARLKDVSQLVLCGNIQVTAQTMHQLCEAGIPIVHLSMGHWFYGLTHGINLRNAFDRAAQFTAATDTQLCLSLAKQLVTSKGANQRTMIRRNASVSDRTLSDMSDLLDRVPSVKSCTSLLGLEGALAACYFKHFADMLKPRDFDAQWDFNARNRRPPRDPVNALLSFGYAMLTKEFTVALLAEGLDPWWGLYHKPRHGRPTLALDLMEPFRPLIVDSAVVTAVNTGMIRAADFTRTASACMLRPAARKAFLRAYEARLDQLVTHPLFDYRCAWRVMIRLHARFFSRWLRGDIPEYVSITTR